MLLVMGHVIIFGLCHAHHNNFKGEVAVCPAHQEWVPTMSTHALFAGAGAVVGFILGNFYQAAKTLPPSARMPPTERTATTTTATEIAAAAGSSTETFGSPAPMTGPGRQEMVFCTSGCVKSLSGKFHTHKKCRGLNQAVTPIQEITVQAAEELRLRRCAVCLPSAPSNLNPL